MALSAQDQMDIRNLIARYNFAIDFGEAEAWADTFTPDGVFESPLSTASGRAELVAFAERGAEAKGVRHWVNNVVIDGEGVEATTKVYLTLYQLHSESEPETLVTGFYTDTLVRTDGGWRFKHRKVTFDAGSGVLARRRPD